MEELDTMRGDNLLSDALAHPDGVLPDGLSDCILQSQGLKIGAEVYHAGIPTIRGHIALVVKLGARDIGVRLSNGWIIPGGFVKAAS